MRISDTTVWINENCLMILSTNYSFTDDIWYDTIYGKQNYDRFRSFRKILEMIYQFFNFSQYTKVLTISMVRRTIANFGREKII